MASKLTLAVVGKAVISNETFDFLKKFVRVIYFSNLEEFRNNSRELKGPYALWVHFDSRLTSDVFQGLQLPEYLISTTTGLTHIDESILRLLVSNKRLISLKDQTEFLNTITSTAEHTWLLIFNLISNFPVVLKSYEDGTYDRNLSHKRRQLSEMTIGIIGLGRLGKMTYRLSRNVFSRTLAFDIDSSKYIFPDFRLTDKAKNLNSLLSQSDVIVIHASVIGDRTRYIINEGNAEFIKKGAYLVNTARAGLIDPNILLNLVQSRYIDGYASDVPYGEETNFDASVDLELTELKFRGYNIIQTPHIAGGTASAIMKCEMYLANELERLVRIEGSK